jgi:hypothetical protein
MQQVSQPTDSFEALSACKEEAQRHMAMQNPTSPADPKIFFYCLPDTVKPVK